MENNTRSSSSLPLAGRVAIVTGATRGMGRAIAIHLHSVGARVTINYVSSSSKAELLVSELNDSSQPKSAIAVRADVSDPEQINNLFDQTEQEFGSKVHILVNCAGVLDPKYPTIAETTLEDFENTFTINTRGSFLCCKEAAKRVVRGGGGRIIIMSTSMVGGLSPGYGVYAASKAAVETMVKVLAKELKGSGITANCVAPGPVETEMFFAGKSDELVKNLAGACPMGRIGEPKDISEIVGFLAGDGGEWINGQVIRANGGFVI
ncbi:PREDICTED: short-chain type dehydrogenase/reductase-like [Camelina sativa]|uniref:Short-chain type dehydrogenase/reductase-like n=1 Tax=Camelina sativa TaxID=90675 RepID=A0ABM0V3Q4_CAMSA|nr:PREDICTED: short-chain type dehydrogenase/reductase-like [Camelina sativa]